MDAPKYPKNPELGMVPRLYFGPADPEYFLSGRYQKERWELGIANQMYLLVAPDVQWDPTRAPAGRFAALVEEFTCPWRQFSEKQWLKIKKDIEFRMVEEWGRYAPNVTMDNFISAWIATPDDVVNRNPCMPQGGWGALDANYERLGKTETIPGGVQLQAADKELLPLLLGSALGTRYWPRQQLRLLQGHCSGPGSEI